MGYGKRAMQQLIEYYSGNITNLNEEQEDSSTAPLNGVSDNNVTDDAIDGNLLEESIKPRKDLPPLLLKLNERRAENLDYLGVSYGLTADLLRYVSNLKTYIQLSVFSDTLLSGTTSFRYWTFI